jgi:two-component sensor histidine kinase
LRPGYLAALAGCLALVPLLLFTVLWIRSELGKGQREIENVLAGQAAALSQRIDAELAPQLAVLNALVALPGLREPDSDFDRMATSAVARMPRWSALALVDLGAGRALTGTRPDWPQPAIYPAVSDRLRQVAAPGVLATEDGGSATTLYLFAPLPGGRDPARALIAGTDTVNLQALTEDQGRATRLMLSVVDRSGRVLTRSVSPDDAVGQPFDPKFSENVAGKTSGLFNSSGPSGEQISSAFVQSSLTGWTSLVSMNQRQIERMSTRTVWTTIAAGTLSLILAGVLIVFVAYTVTERRVTDERLAASRALGELDARLLATTQEALTEQRKAASEREVLLREIYHRVKNNLQIVQSLLRLGARDLKPEQREPFEGAVRRIGAMARVHTLLYNSPDLASIDFKDYLDELIRELSDGFAADERSIESVLDAHSMRVPLDTAVPLAFIAVEILTNSFRHAFPEGRTGKIQVEIRHDEPFGSLMITDDGIGITPDPAIKPRLGLTIVRKLVQQIGGSLEEPPPGSSTFVVRFPLPLAEKVPHEQPRPAEEATT